MKVLIVSEDIPNPHLGGLGKHALNLAHALAALSHSVDVLGSANHPAQAHPEQLGPGQFFGELQGYERGWKQRQLGAFHAHATLANARPVRDAILRHAPRYDVVHYHGHLPWLAADLPASVPFVQTRHDQGGDCMLKTRFIDGDGPRAGLCQRTDPADCAGCATPAPVFWQRQVTSHAVRHMRELTRKAYERHPAIFVSAFLQRNFERAVKQPVGGRVVPNAVDTRLLASVAPPPRAREGGSGLRLFAAGAMFAYKGFGPLLEALAAASRQTGRAYRLRLAGSGPLEAGLRERFAAQPVEFLGWSAYADVLAETRAADAVIVPSLCEEPCATSILEALALGKTVYALGTGGTPEMLAYARSAGGELKLFDGLDALAQAVLRHEDADARAPAGTPLAFENSVERMAQKVEEIYREVVARRARHSSG